MHSFIDGKALYFHPKITEFVKLMENTQNIDSGDPNSQFPQEIAEKFDKESKAYGEVLRTPMDIFNVSCIAVVGSGQMTGIYFHLFRSRCAATVANPLITQLNFFIISFTFTKLTQFISLSNISGLKLSDAIIA